MDDKGAEYYFLEDSEESIAQVFVGGCEWYVNYMYVGYSNVYIKALVVYVRSMGDEWGDEKCQNVSECVCLGSGGVDGWYYNNISSVL